MFRTTAGRSLERLRVITNHLFATPPLATTAAVSHSLGTHNNTPLAFRMAASSKIHFTTSAANLNNAEDGTETVACIIIGDEVLNGKTKDTNSHWLAKMCFDNGMDLQRVVVVPDKPQDIIENVRDLSARYSLVFTSGGIGPTHDDITYESIAKAYNLPLKLHDPTVKRMKEISERMLQQRALESGTPPEKYEITEPRKRMALFPYSTSSDMVDVVSPAPHLWVPIVIVNKNVHILPGIPKLFQDLLSHYFEKYILPRRSSRVPFTRKLVGTSLMESDIAVALTDIQAQVEPLGIKVGSYPKWKPLNTPLDQWKLRVVVSLVGKNKAEVERWAEVVRSKIDGFDVSVDE
ncbi:hypothetical protein HK102_001823 [Quaeritorhiza haematococci]|nr:hypothetical protein HK102_001823 [Quaeritorhiza haematococci]